METISLQRNGEFWSCQGLESLENGGSIRVLFFFSKLQYILNFWDIKREKGRTVVLFRERVASYVLDEIL